MSGLHMTAIQIVVGEDGATHRTDYDTSVLYAEIKHGLAYELMQNAVTATGTIVGGSGCGSTLSGKIGIHARMPADNLFYCSHL
jgi:hypothetical protein